MTDSSIIDVAYPALPSGRQMYLVPILTLPTFSHSSLILRWEISAPEDAREKLFIYLIRFAYLMIFPTP
jgi:hypothetical protein